MEAPELVRAHPGHTQSRAAVGLGTAAADGAHVGDVGAERRYQRGLVDLRIMGEDDHRVIWAEAALGKRTIRPVGNDLEALEARLLGEQASGVDQERCEPGPLGERGHVLGNVPRSDNPDPGSRQHPIEDDRVVIGGVERRAPVQDPARPQVRFRDRDLASGGSFGGDEGGEQLHERCRGSPNRLDEDLDRAAAHQPHLQTLLVADPIASKDRHAAAQDGQRVLHDVPLDAAAAHRPGHRPIGGDGELGTDAARSGPLDPDDGGKGGVSALGSPGAEGGQCLVQHRFSMRPMDEHPDVVAVILAAGQGTRFGGPKVDARLDGRSFLDHVVERLREAGVTSIIAVVPPGHASPPEVRAVANPAPERGLSSSLRLGVEAAPAGLATLLVLVDQPTTPVATLWGVLAARGQRPIVAAQAGGRLGPPVLLEPGARSVVMAPTGDIGLRAILRNHPDLVTAVAVDRHAPDVDTADDLAALEGR